MDNKEGQEEAGQQEPDAQSLFFETCGLRILRALRRIIRAVDIHSRNLNTAFKITAPQMICLYSLVRDGRMTLSALADKVNLGASTVNGIIDRLEAKGLAVRQRSGDDRRKVFIDVTESGRELTRSAPSLLQDRFAAALRNLSELEQAAIALSLERIVELMEAEHLEASPNLITDEQLMENTGEEHSDELVGHAGEDFSSNKRG